MKHLSLILIVLTLSCENENKIERFRKNNDTPAVPSDTTTVKQSNRSSLKNQFAVEKKPNSIWNKPVAFYFNNKACSKLAIEFYYGQFLPSDNDSTDQLLSLVITENSKLRPFYRWCLNETIRMQDGALAEHTGVPARKYVEQFPQEFFEYMMADSSGKREADWISSILYSGYYKEDNYEKPELIQKKMAETMKENCQSCDQQTIHRIEVFTKKCFYE